MRLHHTRESGAMLLEFTLIGIPLLFVPISVFELCRGMWTYQMVGSSVKAGTRYAVVHGQNCAVPPNVCLVTIGDIAGRIQATGRGLLWNQFNVTFTSSDNATISCAPLSNCFSNGTTWPPLAVNAVGKPLQISGTYPFNSIISMFWPGNGPPTGTLGSTNFGAVSVENIQF